MSRSLPPATRLAAVTLACALAAAGCTGVGNSAPETPPSTTTASTPTHAAAPSPSPSPSPSPAPTATGAALPPGVAPRPAWLGTRVLPRRSDGFGQIRPTPDELRVRRFATDDELPPPADGGFHAQVTEVPDDVVARSTWSPECPVTLDELRYVRVSFWGFDERSHTGELLVNTAVADDIVGVFEKLFDARFPIERMHITPADELDDPPTGDGNDTGAFVCRPSTGQQNWSQHAYGLAIDIDPFQNPYVKDDLVLPELASAYTDRSWTRPGMIADGDVVTRAFDAIGWGWGGRWHRPVDRMHFSRNGH